MSTIDDFIDQSAETSARRVAWYRERGYELVLDKHGKPVWAKLPDDGELETDSSR